VNLVTEDDFVRHGFCKRSIGTAPEHSKYIGLGILGKRRQFGLRHRLAATIHAGMGQDLPALVTCVTGDDMYHLFQREQVVVLLSRTHYAKDIIFVGDPDETAEALASMLDKDGPYSEYMEYLVRKLVHRSPEQAPSIDLATRHPYCAMNVDVPNGNTGFCYLMVSMAKGSEGKVTYIGQTPNLVARFEKHKRGAGPSATADPGLKPWAILAYVSGFEGADVAGRMYLERLWQVTRDRTNAKRRRQNMSPLDANEVANLGKEIIERQLYRSCHELADKNLVFVRCGMFQKS
jgi:predicted GIY-YIG superfamily endonuclease